MQAVQCQPPPAIVDRGLILLLVRIPADESFEEFCEILSQTFRLKELPFFEHRAIRDAKPGQKIRLVDTRGFFQCFAAVGTKRAVGSIPRMPMVVELLNSLVELYSIYIDGIVGVYTDLVLRGEQDIFPQNGFQAR